MFKVGDRVVCIDNISITNGNILKKLTVGETYVITEVTDEYVYVDVQGWDGFYPHRFLNIKEQRKRKLERCLR